VRPFNLSRIDIDRHRFADGAAARVTWKSWIAGRVFFSARDAYDGEVFSPCGYDRGGT
jgi:hypothetical protein